MVAVLGAKVVKTVLVPIWCKNVAVYEFGVKAIIL